MANTRFMERMFSATENKEEEVLNQVANDIQEAKANGEVDTDELKYETLENGQVLITDKANNEITIAEQGEEGNIDLYNPEDQLVEEESKLEGFLHPEVEGEVIPGGQTNPTDNAEEHLEEGVISPNLENGGKNPEAGCEKSVEETAAEGPEGACPECEDNEEDEEEKQFSVYSNNTVIQKIFSQQEYCEMLFSDVIASEDVEDVAKVGNLKIEKVDDDTVIVSDLTSGDQAKVTLDDEEMEVEELGHKDFSEEGEEGIDNSNQFEPIHVVGVDAGNHVLVDSPVYDEEAAEELADRLTEAGVDGVQVLADETEARDYVADLLNNLGVESDEDVEEPEEATFSDVDGNEYSVYLTRYYSNNTVFMDRLFSETDNGIETSQAKIEDALENGDEIETEEEIVTPISSTEAVVEDKDNGEFTKVTIKEDNMELDPLSEEEANDLLEDVAVSEDEVDEDEEEKDAAEEEAEENLEDEKDFSDILTNEAETRFFSESEPMNQYMIRLFSEEENEELIEKAIEDGDQIENDKIVITPVDSETAVIEDKENDEFTKAVLSEDSIDVTPITEEEADDLTEDLAVSEDEEKVEEEGDKKEEDKKEEDEDKKDEKEFSDNILDKWFAEAVTQAAPVQPAQTVAPVPAPVEAANAQVQVDENGNPVAVEAAPSVEAIEDKAIAAVQQIQAAAAEAEAQILNAKSAPAENAEADLQEATFSENNEEAEEKTFSEDGTLMSWLNYSVKR